MLEYPIYIYVTLFPSDNTKTKRLFTLIDTSSAESIVRTAFAHLLSNYQPRTSGSQSLEAADGNRIPVVGTGTIAFYINGQLFKTKVLVVEGLPIPFILGIRFLTECSAYIDIKNKLLTVQGLQGPTTVAYGHYKTSVVTMLQDTKLNTRKIKLATNEVIKPGETREIPCITSGTTDAKNNSANYISIANDAATLQYGCVFTVDGNRVMCSVVGRSLTKLYEGTVISELVKPSEVQQLSPSLLIIQEESKPLENIVHNINSTVTGKELEKLNALLIEFRDVFSLDASEMGRTDLVQHEIETGDAMPIHSRPYRVSQKEREIIRKQVNEMLTNGVITPSTVQLVLTSGSSKEKR